MIALNIDQYNNIIKNPSAYDLQDYNQAVEDVKTAFKYDEVFEIQADHTLHVELTDHAEEMYFKEAKEVLGLIIAKVDSVQTVLLIGDINQDQLESADVNNDGAVTEQIVWFWQDI